MRTLGAQTPSAQSSGSVGGRVVDAETLSPLEGVRVGSEESGWTTTDSEGRYRLTTSFTGSARIRAEGGIQTLGGSRSKPALVRIQSGQNITLDFRVRLSAEIHGRVLDEEGIPLAGIRVVAVTRRYTRLDSASVHEFAIGDWQYRPNTGMGFATTDDLGRYAIKLLTGSPAWLLAYRPSRSDPATDSPSNVDARIRALVPAYYPGARSVEAAVPIVLHSLEVRGNVEIVLSRSPSHCIEAVLTIANTPTQLSFAIAERQIHELFSDSESNWTLTGLSRPDGRLRVCGLYPGSYRLSAFRPTRGPLEHRGTAEFVVTDHDIQGVTVLARPQVTIRGEVLWDQAARNTPDAAQLSLSLRLKERWGTVLQIGAVRVPGEFTLTAFPQIPHSLSIFGLRPPFYVKDLTYNASSVRYSPLLPGEGGGVLRMVIGNDGGTLSAHVSDQRGQPSAYAAVMAFPANAQSESDLASDLVSGLTDESGLYLAAGLRPGRYYVLATTEPPPFSLQMGLIQLDPTPEALARLLRSRGLGQLVEVGPSATVQVDLIPELLK